MRLTVGKVQVDVLDDGLFELRPETFVKIAKGRNAELLNKSKFRPRIKVGFNSLLLRGDDLTVIVDPGTGDKERIAERRSYNLDWPRRVFSRLKTLGLRREDIDLVVLTHLHWDHAGACTTIGFSGQLEPTFPRAKVVLQATELENARRLHLAGDDGYSADDYEPLDASRKFELLTEQNSQVLPWLSCQWTGGHTAGHMAVRVGNDGQPGLFYLSDLLPTTAQLAMDSGMSYDQNPDELAAAKRKYLSLAAENEDAVVLVHAPRNRLGRLKRVSEDNFTFEHIVQQS